MSDHLSKQTLPRKRVMAMAGFCALALLGLTIIAYFGGQTSSDRDNQVPISKSDQIRVKVNDRPVYQSQIDLAKGYLPAQGTKLDENSTQNIIDHLIQQKLLAQAAEQSDIIESPKVRNQIQLAKEQIFAKAMVDHHLATTVTEQSIRDFYDSEIRLNPPGQQVKARQILLPDQATATEIVRRLDKGDSFASLALAFSIDRASRESGGDLGYLSWDMLDPDLTKTIFEAGKNGQLEPFKTADGWHVVEVLGRRQAPLPSYESRRDTIETLLKAQSLETLLEQLKTQADIKFSDSTNEEAPK